MSRPKVAIVCDWLTNVGGAERVLKSIHDLYPDAPIYTSQYDERGIDWFKGCDIRVGWLQIFPAKLRRFLGPLRQSYFNHLDLSDYDLIISVTGAEAKSVKKGTATHICYCHVPTQYYWQLYDDYVKDPGFGILNPVVKTCFKLFVKPLRKADYKAAQRPDVFVTISNYSAEQIKAYYGRESIVIAPPVAVEKFSTGKFSTSRETINSDKSQHKDKPNNKINKNKKQVAKTEQAPTSLANAARHGFVITSRHVTWKRVDLAIKACIAAKRQLTVIGEGPETKNLRRLAHNSALIKFVPLLPQEKLHQYLVSSEAFIFPSLEPFGIAPVEALACGCPVIAYGKGGALDYVIDGENGILFGKQSVNSLRLAIQKFEAYKFDANAIAHSALPFSEKYFQDKLSKLIKVKLTQKVKGNVSAKQN